MSNPRSYAGEKRQRTDFGRGKGLAHNEGGYHGKPVTRVDPYANAAHGNGFHGYGRGSDAGYDTTGSAFSRAVAGWGMKDTPTRAPRGQPDGKSNDPERQYHFKTFINLRSGMLDMYTRLADFTRKEGAEMSDVEMEMQSLLSCPVCNELIDDPRNNVHVAVCGHTFHRNTRNCWAEASAVTSEGKPKCPGCSGQLY